MRRTAQLLLLTNLVAGVAFAAGDESTKAKEHVAAPDDQVTCAAAGVEVTVRLSYEPDRIGLVSACYVDLGFTAPLALPPDATADQLRGRLKTLVASTYRIAAPVQRGSIVRVAVTTTEPGIPPEDLFRLRFDCPAGTQVRPRDFTCATAEVGDSAGQPMAEKTARQVRCAVSHVAPADTAAH